MGASEQQSYSKLYRMYKELEEENNSIRSALEILNAKLSRYETLVDALLEYNTMLKNQLALPF